MANYTTAPVKFLKVGESTFAYRLFGTGKDVPLLMPTHFRGRLDFWDPALINPLAARRMLLLLDNQGSTNPEASKSSEEGLCFKFWAEEIISFVKTLGYNEVDVLGFSMGGFIAQMMALQAPAMVRKLVLAGTAPSEGPGLEPGDMQYLQNLTNATSDSDIKAGFLAGYFGLSEERQILGQRWWSRITPSSLGAPFVTTNDVDGQIMAMMRWHGHGHRDEGSYDRLHEIKCPTLIVSGQQDRLVPEQNSVLLWQKISPTNPNVQLHIYPVSGHGFLFEFHEDCARLVNEFLDRETQEECTCGFCEVCL